MKANINILDVSIPKTETRQMRFSKVLVVNLPSPPGYVANRDSMGGFGQLFPEGAATPHPPLDVPYLVSYLLENKVPVEVVEAMGSDLSMEKLANRVAELADRDERQKTLVTVRTSAPTLDWDISVCKELKKATKNIDLAMYGPVVPHVLKRLYQESVFDYLIAGEPDDTVLELANGSQEEKVSGLIFRQEGQWAQNPTRPFLKELDNLPFPKWEMFPYQRYSIPKSSATAAVPFLPMLTSRGCPFGCHYCPYPVGQGLPWRYRSPQNVVDEIEHLVKNLGIEYILFRDPMFSMGLKRVNEICAEIQKRHIRFKWKCETRPDCLDEETVKAMAAAGCDGINFGIESVAVEIQSGVGRKPIPKEEIIHMTALCRKYGIKTFCFFIIGLPGDTVLTIMDTIAFAIRLKANWVQFTAATPFIGTKLREWSVAQGLVTEDEYAYINSHTATVGNENLSKHQIETLHRFAKFIERYLLNRGGILKDDNRNGFVYSAARGAADATAKIFAATFFKISRLHFERIYARSV